MTTNPTSKQDLILNAFITLLIQGGYQSATINKTAEVAGVNPSTIFRKFTDKEGLLSAVVERHLHDLSTIFDGMVVIGDVEKDLMTMSQTYQEFQANHQEIVLVGVQESFRMPEMSRAVEEIPLQFKQMLREYFTDMRAQHKISDQVDIEAATMNMIWLNFGYFLAAIRFENPDLVTPPEDFYDKQIRFFAKSLSV